MSTACAAPSSNAAACYVLVHGSWHGSWCWTPVARRLRSQGMEVFTPNLTGCGANAHLLDRNMAVDFEMHVRDVIDTLAFEDLQNVILVGHSYGALVVSAASVRQRDRIRGVVLLDGYVVAADQPGLAAMRPERQAQARQAIENGERHRPCASAASLGITVPQQAAWTTARLRAHPWACYASPVAGPSSVDRQPPWVYIRCTQGELVSSFESSEAVIRERGWPVLTLDTGHDAMISNPCLTADKLQEAARYIDTLGPPGP